MNTHRQHGVTIGGKTYRVDENGKFVLVEDNQEDEQ